MLPDLPSLDRKDNRLLPHPVPPVIMPRVEEDDVIAWLESGAPFVDGSGAGCRPVRRIDTHAASIFLSGERAWKLKRPVRFGYLDFSTSDKRHAVLEAELTLNRRTAPGLYRALHRITREADGALALDGAGETVDWLLEMRRFADGALFEELAAGPGLDDALILALADQVAALHGAADIVRLPDGAARLRRVAEGNMTVMTAFPALLEPEKVAVLTKRIGALIDHHAALLDARGRGGCIRHVHGDLHLGNIALVDGQPVAFDRLEFDTDLATIDVLYDLAFLLMDLWERGLTRQASMLFNRYLDLGGAADEEAAGLLSLFMAVRASIRAHVLATRVDQGVRDPAVSRHARHYLDFALSLLEQVPARLIAIGGLSGTGKSTLARVLGGDAGPAPGARILRSDVVRKRLAGVAPEERLDPGAYTREASRAVYAELDRLAGAALGSGLTVIADGVFAAAEERAAIRRVADAAGCRFDGLWLTLGEEGRIARIEGRSVDASDADAGVAREQTRRHPETPEDWIILDAGGERGRLATRAKAALGL